MIELSQLENAYNAKKQRLDLQYMNLTDSDIPTICSFLKNNPEIGSLDLSDNDITDEGVRQFINQTSIESLTLRNNPVGPQAMAFLAQDRHINILDVSFTQIGDAGAQYLSTNPRLRALYALGCGISEVGVASLVQLRLMILDLCFNQIKDAGAQILASSSTIEELVISECGITDVGGTTLAHNNKIQILVMGNNSITDATAHELSLKANFKILSLGGTNLTLHGARALRSNKNIVDLDLPEIPETRLGTESPGGPTPHHMMVFGQSMKNSTTAAEEKPVSAPSKSPK